MDKETLTPSSRITVGLLLFGLFFGAGNIIFPVKMGQLAGQNALPAAIGFIITAVGLPILAVVSASLSAHRTLKSYASPGGKIFSLLFTLALYLTIGPFFAIPRTATVAYEVGLSSYFTNTERLPLLIYSLIFFSLVLFFAVKPEKIMAVVGRFLTPFFLLLIIVLLLATVFSPLGDVSQITAEAAYSDKALSTGILEGYNTMDVLAGLAFFIIITQNLMNLKVTSPSRIAKETAISSIVTILLFTLLYGGLVWLGANSRLITDLGDNGGVILAKVSRHYFGPWGQLLLALTIAVACLKTAIGLIISIGDTFHELFPKTAYRFWVYAFTLISFIIANFGLSQIISYSIPVLMFLYPLAIALLLLWLLRQIYYFRTEVFIPVLLLTGLAAIPDFIKALPDSVKAFAPLSALMAFAKTLPLFDLGLFWLLPAAAGLIIGLLLFRGVETKPLSA